MGLGRGLGGGPLLTRPPPSDEAPAQLLEELTRRGARLQVHAGELVVRAPRGVLDAALRARIEAHRPALLAALEASAADRRVPPVLPEIEAGGAVPEAPLTFAQERLWFLEQLHPGNPAYNIACALELAGELDVEALEAALGELVRRHDSLRTGIVRRSGGPVQTIVAALTPELPRGQAGDDEARQLALEEARRPFDLSRAPLFRTRLLQLRGPRPRHLLVLVLHHIVGDAWSSGVLARELGTLYAAFTRGEPSPLLHPPLRIADVARWQRRHLSTEALAPSRRVLEGLLAGAPETTALPTDLPRPEVLEGRGASAQLPLPAALLEALDALARAQGVTRFVVLLAAFQVLLHRFSGQDDLVLGFPVAGRHRPGLESLVGLLVNTLVLRRDLGDDPTFTTLLQRNRDDLLTVLDHQDLPFEKLVEGLPLSRRGDRTPLFRAMFVLQNAPEATLEMPGLEISLVELPTGAAKFDLTLQVTEGPGDPRVSLEYAAELFLPETAAALLEAYRVLLEDVARDAGRAVSRLRLAAGPVEVLDGGPAVPAPAGAPDTLHDLFEAQAAARPEAVAVRFEGERVSYADLARRARTLASELQAAGVGPGSRVGLCLPRSVELVVGVLGISMSGATYVPVDPEAPAARRRLVLDDAAVRVMVDEGGVRGEALPGDASPDLVGCSYILYTSGSTGDPNGVPVRHDQVMALLRAGHRVLDFRPDDVWSLFHSVAFDFSVWELWGALTTGAQLWVVPLEVARSPRRFHARLVDMGVTALNLTPSAFHAWAPEALRDGRTGAMRWLLLSGEALDAGRLAPWMERFGGAGPRVVNAYGITETTVLVTARELDLADTRDPQRSPLGRPLPGMSVRLLDAAGQPVPRGFPGEIHVSGTGVTRGYWRRPDRTRERFLRPSPEGPLLYRSGDLARRTGSGELVYLGRRDQQVKLRGYRIELGEVEAALHRLPEISQAAVLRREDPGGGPRLVAYVVPATEGPAPTPEALRATLAEHLLPPMVPAEFVTLTRLPLTTNGKVDRRALPPPPPPAGGGAPTAREPMGPREAALAEELAALLGRPSVDPETNFFDLGAHSLLLVEAQARLEARLGREVPLVLFFHHPTVRLLARALEEPGESLPPSRPRGQPGSTPDPAEPVAILGMAGRFPGAPDLDTFWDRLVDGRGGVRDFDEAELRAAGVAEAEFRSPGYVAAAGWLDGVEDFDAEFFRLTPREAEVLDPQQRLFLECAWHALEDAGHTRDRDQLRIGVFASAGFSRYLLRGLRAGFDGDPLAAFQAHLGNDKDFLPTRVAYALGLRGPAVAVQTACSSSLVAVHMARRSLLAGECDLALAGGVSLLIEKRGYRHHPGAIASPDGRCRPFDARAAGTVGGSGLGVVVLRPLEASRAAGDPIRALIRGSAVNNDGRLKVGFVAPSVQGQSEVLRAALRDAAVSPETVGYVEAHGTGTPLGDPVEVRALRDAYGPPETEAAVGRVALASLKASLGHLDAAAGVAGLIKAVLAIEAGRIPQSLHFESPHPELELEGSRFHVPTHCEPWPDLPGPRRAGVSAFGIGGTNAHLVLEQAPPRDPPGVEPPAAPHPGRSLLTWSARSAEALAALGQALARRLSAAEDGELPGLAATLRDRRAAFEHRAYLVADSAAAAAAALAAGRHPVSVTDKCARPELEVTGAEDAAQLEQLGARWLEGARLRSRTPGVAVPLPRYPFQRRRHWLELPDTRGPKHHDEVDRWLYQPGWRRLSPLMATPDPLTTRWLLVADPEPEVEALEAALRGRGAGVERLAPGQVPAGPTPDRVLFLAGPRADYAALGALAGSLTGTTTLGVVTRGRVSVLGDEPLTPGQATLLGPVRCLPHERPWVTCRTLDLGPRSTLDEALLVAWMEAPGLPPVTAHRGAHLFAPTWEAWPPGATGRQPPAFVEGGVVLITGGLGGLGLSLAEHLAQRHQAPLVLVSRGAARPSEAVRARLDTLRAAGAPLLVEAADVADREAMAAVLDRARRQLGPLHGIVHAAGVAGAGPLDLESPEVRAAVFAAKIEGTEVLAELTREHQPAWLALFAALGTETGGPGHAAYVAANAFQDAFAEAHPTLGRTRVVSLDWSAWTEVGMAAASGLPPELLAQGIPEAAGLECLGRALESGAPRLAVSPHDLPALLEFARTRLATPRRRTRAPRPALPRAYLAPRTPLETTLVEAMEAALGVAPVGVHDDFFQLGGDSLALLEIQARLQPQLGRGLPAGLRLPGSTAAEMATALGGAPPSCLVSLRDGPDEVPPLVCVHAVSGTVFPFRELAGRLTAPRRVYGIQAVPEGTAGSVEAMAAAYLTTLRRQAPAPGYVLLGWSFGCSLALEMAQGLVEGGEAAPRLLLLDYPAPTGEGRAALPEEALDEHFEADLAGLEAAHPGALDAASREHLRAVFRAHMVAAARYRAGPYMGPLEVLRAAAGPFAESHDPSLGWGGVSPQVTTGVLPGDHHSVLVSPGVEALAAWIERGPPG